MFSTSTLPFRFAITTGTSPQNSQISCRHAPQGGVTSSVSVTTAIASNFRSPSLIALKIATRSAHTVNPYVAFSTFEPPNIFPEAVRNAAPTLNLENGACAFSRAALAAETNESNSDNAYPPISERCRDVRNHRAQQCYELIVYPFGRRQHFFMFQRLIQDSSCGVGDAGNS
jgi:hypothetical protein